MWSTNTMNSTRLASALMALLLLMTSVPNDALAAPTDIAVLRSLTDKDLKSRKTASVKAELERLALARTDALSKSRGYPLSLRSSNPRVQSHIRDAIASSLGSSALVGNRAKQVVNLGLTIMSGELSEKAIAYAAFLSPPTPPKNTSERRLSDSSKVSGRGPLVMDLEKSWVAGDKGTIGANNGILDPGEVATLNLNFANISTERLVSTSLYVQSLSECLFTSETLQKEIELAELAPKKLNPKTGEYDVIGRTSVQLSVYASSECAGRTGTIVINAHDTHRFSSTPIRYALTLSLSDAAEARLVNVRVDRDDYGHSEPTGKVIQPNDQIEISAGLAVRQSDYSFAHQTFLPPPAAAEAKHSPGPVDFRTINGRNVAPMHDDLDLTFPSKQALLQRLAPMANAYGWQNPSDAKVYVALDTTVGKKGKTKAETRKETAYLYNANALRQTLANHLRFGVAGSSSDCCETEQIKIGQVGGFTVEMDNPGPLLSELQKLDLTVEKPVKSKDSAYKVRHYIELPIFWERILATSCMVSAPRSARPGQTFPVGLRFGDVPVGSTVSVNGLGVNYSETAQRMTDSVNAGTATMVGRNSEISLRIVSPDGDVICNESHRVANSAPPRVAKKPPVKKKKAKPELPMFTGTLNGHILGLGGYDMTASVGRKYGVLYSRGRIDYGSVWMVGVKATQLLQQGDVFQLNLTESIEFGRGWTDTLFGPYSHTRAAVYLSAHRTVGFNIGIHFESDEYGAYSPSFRAGFGGFFGAKYD